MVQGMVPVEEAEKRSLLPATAHQTLLKHPQSGSFRFTSKSNMAKLAGFSFI